MELSNNDCLSILKYYKVNTKNMSKKKYCNLAEKYLANKLCRCIKKVGKYNNLRGKNPQAIAICKNSVLKKKGLTTGRFKCQGKSRKIGKARKIGKVRKINKTLKLRRKSIR